jgi:hypothetical protein
MVLKEIGGVRETRVGDQYKNVKEEEINSSPFSKGGGKGMIPFHRS